MTKKEKVLIDNFLSDEELVALTGYKMKTKQARFLKENNIKYYMSGGSRGKPRVFKEDADAFYKI